MTDFTARLERLMKALGICQIEPSTGKHVRRKLENELGHALHFVSNDQNDLLIYPDSLSMDDLVKKRHRLDQELQELKTILSENTLAKAAVQLRQQIKKQDLSQTWPPSTEQNVIPDTVTKFLYSLLTGENKCTNPSERVKHLAASFGSDLVFTCGKAKPPEHILYFYHVL